MIDIVSKLKRANKPTSKVKTLPPVVVSVPKLVKSALAPSPPLMETKGKKTPSYQALYAYARKNDALDTNGLNTATKDEHTLARTLYVLIVGENRKMDDTRIQFAITKSGEYQINTFLGTLLQLRSQQWNDSFKVDPKFEEFIGYPKVPSNPIFLLKRGSKLPIEASNPVQWTRLGMLSANISKANWGKIVIGRIYSNTPLFPHLPWASLYSFDLAVKTAMKYFLHPERIRNKDFVNALAYNGVGPTSLAYFPMLATACHIQGQSWLATSDSSSHPERWNLAYKSAISFNKLPIS